MALTFSQDGRHFFVYHSSKSTDYFDHFFNHDVKFGMNAGSAYGPGVYGIITADPLDSSIGYTQEKRLSLYGANVYEFLADSSKIFFFDYDDYKQTPQGKGVPESEYIARQLKSFGIEPAPALVQILTPANNPDPNFSSIQATAIFRYVTRKKAPCEAEVFSSTEDAELTKKALRLTRKYGGGGYEQNFDSGAFVGGIAGFVYTGQKDGHTFVGWNYKVLTPNRVFIDGQVKDVSKSNAVADYKQWAEESFYETSHPWFDEEHPTEEQKQRARDVYSLFTKYTANDIDADPESGMSGCTFTKVKVHTDGKVDVTFTNNITQADLGKHYYRLTPHDNLFKALNKLGCTFGEFNGGLKFGKESADEIASWNLTDIPVEMWPEHIKGGLKFSHMRLNNEQLAWVEDCTTFDGTVQLVSCMIEDDCLAHFGEDVVVKPGKKCYIPEGAADELAAAYKNCSWWNEENISDGPLVLYSRFKPETREKKLAARAEKLAQQAAEKKPVYDAINKEWNDLTDEFLSSEAWKK